MNRLHAEPNRPRLHHGRASRPISRPKLCALIGLRAWQLDDVRRQPLGETVEFVVIQPGDTAAGIQAAVGFPITWDQADQPSFERMNDRGRRFKLATVLTYDIGLLVFVADDPGTATTLRSNCLAVADRSNLKMERNMND